MICRNCEHPSHQPPCRPTRFTSVAYPPNTDRAVVVDLDDGTIVTPPLDRDASDRLASLCARNPQIVDAARSAPLSPPADLAWWLDVYETATGGPLLGPVLPTGATP